MFNYARCADPDTVADTDLDAEIKAAIDMAYVRRNTFVSGINKTHTDKHGRPGRNVA